MMRVVVALTLLTTAACLDNRPFGSGDYKDNDSGKYIPDNSGQYVHDDSGRYIPDHSGDFKSDGSGTYEQRRIASLSGDDSGTYKNDDSGAYRNDGSGSYKKDDSGSYRLDQSDINSKSTPTILNELITNSLLGLGSNQDSTIIKPTEQLSNNVAPQFESKSLSGFGNSPSATAQVLSPLIKTNFAPSKYDHSKYYDDRRWKILQFDSNVANDGYHWLYETENGIAAEETGKLINKGSNSEEMNAQGFFQYTGPDNVVYLTKYKADGNGFVAEGAHLPKPPPTPIGILKGLEYLRLLGKL